MRKSLLILCLVTFSLSIAAQEQGRKNKGQRQFDPQKFEQQLEQYVVKKSELTQEESDAFLPIFREMRQKEVAVMKEARKALRGKPTSEEECKAAIKSHDNSEVQLKKIQQSYHQRMIKVISAKKTLKACLAIDEFHREAFRKVHKMRRDDDGNNNRRYLHQRKQ